MTMADDSTSSTRRQENFIALADDLAELDAALLAQLDPVDRARQVRARRALWLYADALWDAAKATKPGSEPGNLDGYNCVAALRDFTAELHAAAQQAQADAGDPDSDDDDQGDVDMWAERFDGPGIGVNPMPAYTLPDRLSPHSKGDHDG
ncbi:MAG TPA: hypothetical protein VFV66_20545 [Nonomuraea sp.]|nr:hypothetical protein [Nonomuraea sp.]